ncbi:NAD(+) diphosphatase [Kineosporia sp. R_H_3]|uniref:NAD(+) diphosphatase n=1 Tax=Kineosporia sp. R_H_3 TaxID=1961848 RepID=UPI001E443509|nr:NAD(+) diphosphatase [Kineosporia sp. R_H_3]
MTTHAATGDQTAPRPPLAELALSRATLDRDAERRTREGLLDGLLADPATRVLVLEGDRGLVTGLGAEGDAWSDAAVDGAAPEGPGLLLLDPAAARAAVAALGADPLTGVTAAYLGVDGPDRAAYVLLAVPRIPVPLTGGPQAAPAEHPAPAGSRWAGLREVGPLVDATGAGLLTASVALSNWHSTHPRCARCGEPTVVATAGWSRKCPVCGAEHYPRTDPAVIMAIEDDEGRILLGRQQVWPPKRYSTLAGFVEPGESLEAAVRREVFEEAGVRVGEVTYQGSQPWPFPSSLMLGFSGRATSTEVTVDGEELAHARWWSREELAADVASGELLLPPAVSIARRLVEQWFGGPLDEAVEAWR